MFRSALLALFALALVPVSASAAVSISCAPACTVTAGTEVTFSATPDGTVVAYAWDLDEDGIYGARDGEPEGPSANQVRRTFPDPGRFLVAVRVRDPRGTLAFSRQLVTVETAAEPPGLPPGTPPLPGALPAPPGAAGLVFPAPPAVGADDDGDGSPAGRDLCPDSPAGRPRGWAAARCSMRSSRHGPSSGCSAAPTRRSGSDCAVFPGGRRRFAASEAGLQTFVRRPSSCRTLRAGPAPRQAAPCATCDGG